MGHRQLKHKGPLNEGRYGGEVQAMYSHWCVTVRPVGTDGHLTDSKFMKMIQECGLVDDKVCGLVDVFSLSYLSSSSLVFVSLSSVHPFCFCYMVSLSVSLPVRCRS
jgi:hypothetical protein